MSSDLIANVLVVIIGLSLFITIIILFFRGYRSRGGGSITTMAGATAEMLTEDKKRAMEVLVEQKANKKMEEQASDEPKDKVDDV
jgi:hypothetical protein